MSCRYKPDVLRSREDEARPTKMLPCGSAKAKLNAAHCSLPMLFKPTTSVLETLTLPPPVTHQNLVFGHGVALHQETADLGESVPKAMR